MGETKRRAERRREAAAAGKPVPQYAVPLVEKLTVDLDKATAQELRAEMKARKITHLTQGQFAGQIIELALHRFRVEREAQEAESRLVQPATTRQVAQALAAPSTVGRRTPR